MKNLIQYIEQEPITREYSFTTRNCKHKIDTEDLLFDLPKTTRFRNNLREMRKRKRNHRVGNPFKETRSNSNQLL